MAKLERNLRWTAAELLQQTPALVVEGARQVGKSTFLEQIAPEAFSVTLDDELQRQAALQMQSDFLSQAGDGLLVIDEVQRAPNLILGIKSSIDADRRYGRFMLTGLADLLRIPGSEDSLAGRAMTLRLHPFSQGEIMGKKDCFIETLENAGLAALNKFHSDSDRADLVHRVFLGGYPEPLYLPAKIRRKWFTNYTDRLLRRDADLFGQLDYPLLSRLLKLLAASNTAELVKSRLAQSLDRSASTVTRYLEVLESLFLVTSLPAWSRNIFKRQINRPKTFIHDSGLAAAAVGLNPVGLGSLVGANSFGPLLETFVLGELTRQLTWSETDYALYHLRDRDGLEIDFLVELPDGGLYGIEVKAASGAVSKDFQHLQTLAAKLGPDFRGGIVFHTGTEAKRFAENLWAVPVGGLWELTPPQ